MSGFRTYSPQLPDQLVHALWRRKEATGVPMTRLLAEAVAQYLSDGDRVSSSHPVPESPRPTITKGE